MFSIVLCFLLDNFHRPWVQEGYHVPWTVSDYSLECKLTLVSYCFRCRAVFCTNFIGFGYQHSAVFLGPCVNTPESKCWHLLVNNHDIYCLFAFFVRQITSALGTNHLPCVFDSAWTLPGINAGNSLLVIIVFVSCRVVCRTNYMVRGNEDSIVCFWQCLNTARSKCGQFSVISWLYLSFFCVVCLTNYTFLGYKSIPCVDSVGTICAVTTDTSWSLVVQFSVVSFRLLN